jgi:hypothetical protein
MSVKLYGHSVAPSVGENIIVCTHNAKLLWYYQTVNFSNVAIAIEKSSKLLSQYIAIKNNFNDVLSEN